MRRFFIAHFQSELGNGAAYVALVLIAYQRLHSAWAIALVLLADFVPGIIFAAPFGALADRLPRRRLAVGADILRAVAFLGLAVIPWFGATVGLALLAGVGTALFRPTINAALPGLVTDEQRSPAIGLLGAGISIGLTAGPAITALVCLFGSASLMLAVNGVTFLVSAVLLSTVPLGSGAQAQTESESENERTSLWSSTLEGARSAALTPGVRTLLLIGTGSVLAGGLMNVAEPLLATGALNSGYSVLVAVYGAAMVVGSLGPGRRRRPGGVRPGWLGNGPARDGRRPRVPSRAVGRPGGRARYGHARAGRCDWMFSGQARGWGMPHMAW